jgi:hypothetical protein
LARDVAFGSRFGWPKRVKGAKLRPSLNPSDYAQAADSGGEKPIFFGC